MNKILKILKQSGAFLEGHFQLSSGLHSQYYFQLALAFQNPKLGSYLSKKLAKKFKTKKIDAVIGPALGGIILAYEIAKYLNCKAIFAERENGKMALRRGFKISPNEKILIVEDVTTTAKSIKEVGALIKKSKAKIEGIGTLIDRSEKKLSLPCPLTSLVKIKIKNYQPVVCPLCKKNIPLVKPGSRKQ